MSLIDVIILAGGASTRMGRNKALLTLGGITFVKRIIRLYHGADNADDPDYSDDASVASVSRIVVVVGADAGGVREEVSAENITIVENPHPERGQISSLLAGLGEIEGDNPGAVLVHPVDHPLVSRETVRKLMDAAKAHPGKIVLPVSGRRRGHPVIFPSSMFGELKAAPIDRGARAVVRAHGEDIVAVQTVDRGIHTNIDTDEEYERVQRDMHRTS